MNTKQDEQFEKDIESVIRFLKITDPDNATREHAIEMLGDMQSLAHLVAHKVVEDKEITNSDKNFTSDTYDKIANQYSDTYFNDKSDLPYIDKLLNLIEKDSLIIDIGAGVGNFSQYIANHGHHVIGIDLSKEMLSIAHEKVPDIEFKIMDMRDIKYEDSYFDAALSAYSLIHIPSDEIQSVLKEYNRILKPKGKILIIVQSGQPDQIVDEPLKDGEKIFINFFEIKDLESRLIEQGFKILSSEAKENHDSESMSDEMIYIIAEKAE